MMPIKQVQRSMHHRRQFRTLARDNCGESMEPGENEMIYFGYSAEDYQMEGHPIACGSLLLADPSCTDHAAREFYSWVSFMFVKDMYKNNGYGRQLLSYIQVDAWNHSQHPIRAEVARKAVGFFEKCGYNQYHKAWQSACGSSYFRNIYPMQNDYKEPKEDLWDV